jgi:hypothetical protein
MAVHNWLQGLTSAQLTELQTNYLACLNAIATTGQSYTIGGRTFTRANIDSVGSMLAEINSAVERRSGTRITRTNADFRR